jgi:hypothetical protein
LRTAGGSTNSLQDAVSLPAHIRALNRPLIECEWASAGHNDFGDVTRQS